MNIYGKYSKNNIYSSEYRLGTRNPFPGFYRGRVEFRADPLQLGRVKIRVPQLHGIPNIGEDALTVEQLPYARRMNMGVGGYDTGNFIIPPVGSYVWIVFESGDPKKMVYLGGVDGRDSKKSHPMGVVDDRDDSEVPAGKWDAPVGENEVPLESFEGKEGNEPKVDVIYKSYKGHSIVADLEDEKESFSFIDRAGQIFKMISPLLKSKNRTGDSSFQRGTKDTIKGDQFDYEADSVSSKAVIIIKDLASQLFRMVAEYGKEKLEIVSRDLNGSKRQTVLQMNSGESELGYFLLSEDKETNNKIYIKSDAKTLKLELVVVEAGKELSRVELNRGAMNVHLTENYKMKTKTGIDMHSIDSIKVGSHKDIDVISTKDNGSGNITITALGTADIDSTSLKLNKSDGSPSGMYGGEEYTTSSPPDNTTWLDSEDEKFID